MPVHLLRALGKLFAVTALLAATSDAFAQPAGFNYDESAVRPYTLPELLVDSAGHPIKTADDWTSRRRPELLALFAEHVYGKNPPRRVEAKVVSTSTKDDFLGGKAIAEEIAVQFGSAASRPEMTILLITPKAATGPVPVIVGYNFNGNHAVHADPWITLNPNWMRNDPKQGVTNNKASEASRGVESSRWSIDLMIQRGYGLATIYYGDVDPDFDDGFQNGLHPLFYAEGQTKPHADEWGSIGLWAWGLSRALDVLETKPRVNAKQAMVFGHSRLGKTSLWAGAMDERFALVISNESGCGGAALSRRWFGETTARINTAFPHWFNDNNLKYNDNEAACPVDQHQLIALMAPRPVYIASAAEDLWADPRGEFLSAYLAQPAYALFGKAGLGRANDAQPAVDEAVGQRGFIAYHNRAGKHDVTEVDWKHYLNFADFHFRKSP